MPSLMTTRQPPSKAQRGGSHTVTTGNGNSNIFHGGSGVDTFTSNGTSNHFIAGAAMKCVHCNGTCSRDNQLLIVRFAVAMAARSHFSKAAIRVPLRKPGARTRK